MTTGTESEYTEAGILRQPPYSKEAEAALLGGLLVKGDSLSVVDGIVKPEDFFFQENRRMFEAILRTRDRNLSINPITVADNFEDIDSYGGVGLLMDLASSVNETAGIEEYAELVKSHAVSRAMVSASMDLMETGFDKSVGIDEKISRFQQVAMELAGTATPAMTTSNNQHLHQFVVHTDALHRGEADAKGVMTGLIDLDRLLNGLQKSDLIVVAGRPAMGKSTMAFQVAANAAFRNGENTKLFSLEMPSRQIYAKLIAHLGSIDLGRLKSGKLLDDDWPKLSAAVSMMKDKPFHLDDRGGLHINQICASARRQHQRDPLKLIVIDYLQLVRGDGDNRTQEIGSITRKLKALAKELDCPVVLLSQLNRSVEQRANKRPLPSDLRESGEIEQDADVIIFVYRDEVYNDESPDKGIAELIVAKHRNGPIGTERVWSKLNLSTFSNINFNRPQE